MQRDSLSDLTVFMAIAEHLSFRGAAGRLGLTPSALSHSMRQLEDRLGVRLLNRTTRSVSLTDAGLRLLERLRPAVDQITDALEDLNEARNRPLGRLRIYATNLASVAVVAPAWKRFLTAYPDVNLELEVGEAAIDIVARGFDAGIGPQDRAEADMISVRVMGPIRMAVVAAPSYFAQHPAPRTPDDLARHSCVQYRRGSDGAMFEWPFERLGKPRKVSVSGRVIVNNTDLALRAAVDGLGIGYTPEAQAEPFLRSGQLIRALEDWSPAFEGLFLYYPGRQRVPAALRAFIDVTRAGRRGAQMGTSLENPFSPLQASRA